MVLENAGNRRRERIYGRMMNVNTALANAIATSAAKSQKDSLPPREFVGNVFRRHIIENPDRERLAEHRRWMNAQQREYPLPFVPYRIGVYIRYYNQTKYENYLEKHTQQFMDDIALCPQWNLVDFYIDKGMTAPRMENSKEWCRLLGDCFSGKVNLIVTQKVRSVSNDPEEMSFVARTLAARPDPVGIYFISEDIFTLASYYRADLTDRQMLPFGWSAMPEDELDVPMVCEGPNSLLLEDSEEE